MTNVFSCLVLIIMLLFRAPAGKGQAKESALPGVGQNMNTRANSNISPGQAEGDAYAAAKNELNPARRAAMLEGFIFRYPDSLLVTDAFDLVLKTYEKLDHDHSADASLLLHSEVDDKNILALAVLVFRGRVQISTVGPQSPAFTQSCIRAHKGIQALPMWQKPQTFSGDQYARMRNKAGAIFYGMAGFCESAKGRYKEARTYYLDSVRLDPNDITNLGELGFADLKINPIDVTGFWYAAKSISLARAKFGGSYDAYPYTELRYEEYHGSREGWDEIVAQAANQTAPPSGFSVKPGRLHQ